LRERKPIILIDDSPESQRVVKLFLDNQVEFVKYHVRNFEESCCMELPTTKAPSVIAVEGIFRGESVITSYIEFVKQKKSRQQEEKVQTESSFW
jgi:hypothetical protein